ncbi:hypothetical protein [Bosea sp. RAC05]|jgi:hypothetical protein|uniref:hypothetical protein n=1 Tax=Bosea sp. RAC05 TaxID=1842539 RepID=UPI00083DEFD8|nr:hypothetical protein [Bosea sp. RAC05]AOG06126.1 hypothetical protein BSY19_784 [Bosea sp. RAC05]
MTDTPATPIPIEAKLAEYGLKVGPETLEFLKGAAADLEAAARNIRVKRSYLQEPVHALRLWTK